jgi:hypothetical protein
MRIVWISFALVFVVGLAGGCNRSPEVSEVSGVVTLDGKPLPDVEIVFMPDPGAGTYGPRASCYTDAEGRYRLATDRLKKEGAIVGTHRVIFNDIAALPPVDVPAGDAAPRKPQPVRVPQLYADPAVTPFKDVQVKSGGQTLDFDLKTSAKAR